MKLRTFFSTLFLSLLVFVSTHATALEPNGTASFSELGKQLYLGTLFLDTPAQSANDILNSSQKKRMELRFTGSMSKRRWGQNWTQSIAINSPRETMVSAADDLSAALSAFQGNLEPGDQVIIEYDPLYGTNVSVNGVILVKDKSSALFTLFLSSWIGPVPPSSQFKSAILGQADSKNDYTAFAATKPQPTRISAVKGWSTALKAEEELAAAEALAAEEAKKAEEEAVKKAEEEAIKTAEGEALEEEKRLALIEEEKLKAQEASRKQAEAEAAKRAAEAEKAKAAEEEYSVVAILAQQDYTTQIIRKIYKSVSYPKAAVKKNVQGSVRASVTVNRDGSVGKIAILQQSGFEILDKAALDAINKAAPFPAIPADVKDNSIELMVPIAFKLD